MEKLEKLKLDDEEQRFGVKIVMDALEAPIRTIAANAGAEPAVVVSKVLEMKGAFGYNAATDAYRGHAQGWYH